MSNLCQICVNFDKPRLKGINGSTGQAALICEDRNTAAGEIHKSANWSFNTARREEVKKRIKQKINIYLNEPSCRLVENRRVPLRYARAEIPIFFNHSFCYPGCQRLFMRGFRFRSSLLKTWTRTRETKLPVAREKKPLVPRVSFCTFVCFF